jgi:signal transduction histidine kinase
MTRLKLLISVFFIALSIPLGYFVLLAYQQIEQEEKAELQYFATTLFDDMEEELAALILREENRSVDEYSYYLSTTPVTQESNVPQSPLARLPEEKYILGYLQNNPDGSFQTPLVENENTVLDEQREVTERLKSANTFLNTLKSSSPSTAYEDQQSDTTSWSLRNDPSNFAEKYLDISRLREQKVRVREKEQQSQNITMEQVSTMTQTVSRKSFEESSQSGVSSAPKSLQVEVSPMQSVLMDNQEILIFRRIVIEHQEYRQGFIIIAKEFLNYLKGAYFTEQPMADFANLRLEIRDQNRTIEMVQAGSISKKPIVSLNRTFPRPFSFLKATIACDQLPRSADRMTLNIMQVLMATIILSGLFAIYQSVRTVVELSERRTAFVSSVTHELKTPLTNIRMYSDTFCLFFLRESPFKPLYGRVLGASSCIQAQS